MKTTTEVLQQRDIYAIVTNRIIELLEQGLVPWKKTWSDSGQPQNMITGMPYHGFNSLLLNSLNYPANFFLTFRQVTQIGGKVLKGEKGIPVVFWKWIDVEKKGTEELIRKPLLRYYNVFNISQCEDIPEKYIPMVSKPNNPIHECEMIVENMPQRPTIQFSDENPYYNPVKDFINMRDISAFESSEAYYDTLFHELIHSTGHQSRLNRVEVVNPTKFGSELYSIEELTAEIGCCFLKSHARMQEAATKNNAAYIGGWLKKLKSDKRFILYASAQAQRATDFILVIDQIQE